MYDATMHFKGNQYVEFDGDRGFVETWVIGYHMEASGSPIDSLVLALRYKDDVVRVDGDWKIIRREAAEQWHTGPFPRPFIGEPPYPRRPRGPRLTSGGKGAGVTARRGEAARVALTLSLLLVPMTDFQDDWLDITALINRYAQAVDGKDWALYASCFTTDAEIDYSSAGGARGGVAESTAWLETMLGADFGEPALHHQSGDPGEWRRGDVPGLFLRGRGQSEPVRIELDLGRRDLRGRPAPDRGRLADRRTGRYQRVVRLGSSGLT